MSNLTKIIEKTSNEILRVTLTEMTPEIKKQLQRAEKAEEKEGRTMSTFAKEIFELELIHDLMKAILKYTEDSDKVVEFSAGFGAKGNFEISAYIRRADKIFSFSTEAILAGGYNIQRLHVRYIVRTDLPQTNNMKELVELKNQIKFENKVERKRADIKRIEKSIKNQKQIIEENKDKTREEIIEELKSGNLLSSYDWSKPVKFDVEWHKNVVGYNNQEELDASINEYNERQITKWKKNFIERPVLWISRYEDDLKKENKRLEKILNNK